jgi:Fur family ferric uptake transcriptional regulator
MLYYVVLKKCLWEGGRDMAGTYKTPGRQRLLSFLERHPDRQFLVDDLTAELDREPHGGNASAHGRSSKSTLYRHLSELCDEGTVRKYRSDTQSAYVYQYVGRGDCCHHFHLKCESCGTLIHLECAVSQELLSHIRSDHGFRVDSGRSILYGVCEACSKTEEEKKI